MFIKKILCLPMDWRSVFDSVMKHEILHQVFHAPSWTIQIATLQNSQNQRNQNICTTEDIMLWATHQTVTMMSFRPASAKSLHHKRSQLVVVIYPKVPLQFLGKHSFRRVSQLKTAHSSELNTSISVVIRFWQYLGCLNDRMGRSAYWINGRYGW